MSQGWINYYNHRKRRYISPEDSRRFRNKLLVYIAIGSIIIYYLSHHVIIY